MGDGLGDFEAHVSGFSEYTLSYSTVGLSDCCVGVFVYELGRARDEVVFFLDGRSGVGVDLPRPSSLCLWISTCTQYR